jgi:hypothetical protein
VIDSSQLLGENPDLKYAGHIVDAVVTLWFPAVVEAIVAIP